MFRPSTRELEKDFHIIRACLTYQNIAEKIKENFLIASNPETQVTLKDKRDLDRSSQILIYLA